MTTTPSKRLRRGTLFTGLIALGALCPSPVKADVTFTKDVAPILYANCVSCHRPGEVAPFPLIDYKDAAKRADQLAEVTQDRQMPPWKAEPGHGEFQHERRLTDEQIATIRAWADAGAPEGDKAALPPAPRFVEGWALGEPDLVVEMPQEFTLRAEGPDVFRWFVLPVKLPEDKYVRAVEFRPSNRKIVHHALLFLDKSGKAAELDARTPEIGYEKMGGPGFTPGGGLGGWAPGVSPQDLPEGVARLMPAGSDLIIQTHFHPTGKPETERSRVGLYFAKKEPEKLLAVFPSAARPLDIPAGKKDHRITNEFTVPLDTTLFGIIPHAHLLCKSIKVTATPPGGEERPLIWVKDWDWDWQEHYTYKEPVKIPAGTKVFMEFVYDNSADNIKNPHSPPKRVRWGEQTGDEMALVFFQILADPDSPLAALGGGGLGNRRGNNRNANRGGGAGNNNAGGGAGGALRDAVMQRFDKNKNGELDPDERDALRKAFGR